MFTKRSAEADTLPPGDNGMEQSVAPAPAPAPAPVDPAPRPAVARPSPVAPQSAMPSTVPSQRAAPPPPAAPTVATARPVSAPMTGTAPVVGSRSTVGRTSEPSETGKLHVGREIKFKGEIGTCERLVVEGSVDATLMECRSMEVAPGGFFTGHAQVDTAEIGGHYEGDLTVEGLLTVTSTGRLTGTVRFGELQVERGGTISGSIEIAGATAKI